MIKAVIFDWAGTTVDFGSRAPMGAFVNLFKEYGIEITIEDARRPMGVNKWNHIDELLQFPHIQSQWVKVHGRMPTSVDLDEMLQAFTPMNMESIRQYSQLIPGVREVVTLLRARGIRIGATTGYTRELANVLMPLAAEQGYAPDACVCAGETEQGRPSPQMVAHCASLLGISDPSEVIKVDDTVPGLMEGINFNCWTVGVSVTGNAMGLSLEEYQDLPDSDRTLKENHARQELQQCQPTVVIDSVENLLPVVDEINDRIISKKRSAAA